MKTNALSYHLAFALLQLIRNAEGELYQRLNLIVMIKSLSKSMDSKAKGLDEIELSLNELREAYELELDISPYAYEKRAAFDVKMDEILDGLLKIISEGNLVSTSVMQEVIAGRFDNAKNKR